MISFPTTSQARTIEVPDGKEYKEETVTVTLGKSEDTQNADSKDSQNQDGATDEDGNLLEDWQNNEGGAGLQYGEGWN